MNGVVEEEGETAEWGPLVAKVPAKASSTTSLDS
jgi:hypothetical protein